MSVLRWVASVMVPVLAVTALVGAFCSWFSLLVLMYAAGQTLQLACAALLLAHGTAVSIWLLSRGGRSGDLDRLREIVAMQAAGRQAAAGAAAGKRPTAGARFH